MRDALRSMRRYLLDKKKLKFIENMITEKRTRVTTGKVMLAWKYEILPALKQKNALNKMVK